MISNKNDFGILKLEFTFGINKVLSYKNCRSVFIQRCIFYECMPSNRYCYLNMSNSQQSQIISRPNLSVKSNIVGGHLEVLSSKYK